MKPIDSHAHLLSEAFDEDRETLFKHLSSQMEAVVECASSVADISSLLPRLEEHAFLYGAVGIHPEHVEEWCEETKEVIREALAHKKVVAIGEIGLDYYWVPETAPRQKEQFRAQIELAIAHSLPIIVHNRESTADLLEILGAYPDARGVVHCFTESPEVAKRVLDMGLYIGIGGMLTFKNGGNVRETALYVPMERILLETDAPYLAPVPMRGKRNQPDYVRHVASSLACLKGMEVEEVICAANENARNLFGIAREKR